MTDPGYPCYHCGANAWTACKHRPATMMEPVRPHIRNVREAATAASRYNMPPGKVYSNPYKRKT